MSTDARRAGPAFVASDSPEPCPNCGEGMELQHVCENCGNRVGLGDSPEGEGPERDPDRGTANCGGCDWTYSGERPKVAALQHLQEKGHAVAWRPYARLAAPEPDPAAEPAESEERSRQEVIGPFPPAYGAPSPEGETTECGECRRCLSEVESEIAGLSVAASQVLVCPRCANKRCPHAEWHGYACTGSRVTRWKMAVGKWLLRIL